MPVNLTPLSRGGRIYTMYPFGQRPGGPVEPPEPEPPEITGNVQPVSGPASGGTPVTVNGHGFTGFTGVSFAGNLGENAELYSDTQILVETPPYPNWTTTITVPVTVHHPLGDATRANSFAYTAAE